MRNLLAANFRRLWKSKIFWLISCLMLCFGGFSYICMHINRQRLGISDISNNAYFFQGNLCIGLALSIFSSLFIGEGHTNGGFRNQISVGHRRFPIYLANLILCSTAGILFLLAFWLGGMSIGLPLNRAEVLTQLDKPVWGIFFSFLAAISYCGLFCLIAMLDDTKVRSIVLAMLVAAFLFSGGFATYDGLTQPEYITQTQTNAVEQPEIQKNVPNPKYLTPSERLVYQFLYALLPSCQALRPVMSHGDYSPATPVFALGWTLVLTLSGAAIFQKKDLK